MNFQELSDIIAHKRKLIKKHNDAIDKLLLSCPHNYVGKENYSGGGFDYVSETRTWDECTLCKNRINDHTKYGKHYS